MRAYPQKQTVFILIACVLAVSGVAYYVFHQKNTSSALTLREPIITQLSSSTPTFPAGNWREQFLAYSTSSNAFKAVPAQTATNDPQEKTATYKLGQSFLTQYVLLRQTGLTNDAQGISNAMNNVISQSSASIASPKLYSLKNIRTVPDSIQNLNAYGSVLMDVFAQYSSRQDEADVAAQALENDDASALVRVEPIIQNYKAMTIRLAAAAVPSSLVSYHLDLMNSLSILQFCSNAFRHMDMDPYTGMAAIRADAIATSDSDTLFAALTSYLVAHGAKLVQ